MSAGIRRIIIYLAMFLTIIFPFLPLGKMNGFLITLYPIFDNTVSDYKLWEWINVSAFALTHTILAGFSVYALIKNKTTFLFYYGILFLINALFVLFVLYLTDKNAQTFSDVDFHYSYSWLFILLACAVLLIFTGKNQLNPLRENKSDKSP